MMRSPELGFTKALRQQDGIWVVSGNRPFAHDEAAYDAQYQLVDDDFGPGRRLVEILEEQGVRSGANLLEIGCGTGHLSTGLAATAFFGDLVVTDGSMSFVQITRRKLESIDTRSNVSLALLTDVDTDAIASGYFDVIAMRSVLHHVTDFQAFAQLLLSKLKPGGVLAFFEPRAELFLWMGTLGALFSDVARGKGIDLTDEEQRNIDLFVATMDFYLRRDLDKSAGEDKYAFWSTELLDLAERYGAGIALRSESAPDDLVALFVDYLRYCMSFPDPLIEKFRLGLAGLQPVISGFLRGSPVPDLAAWYLIRR